MIESRSALFAIGSFSFWMLVVLRNRSSRDLLRLAQEAPSDALGDAGRGSLHGIPSEVCVAGGGLNLGVPQELADHG